MEERLKKIEIELAYLRKSIEKLLNDNIMEKHTHYNNYVTNNFEIVEEESDIDNLF